MLQGERTYVYGTAAEKLRYDVYQDNQLLKEKKKHRVNNKFKVRAVFMVAIVFSMGACLLMRYAEITELNYKVDSDNKKYVEILNENTRLKMEIEKEMDLTKIGDLAESKLGMQKPDKYQKVSINIPKNNFTRISDNYKSENSSGILSEFNNLVGGLWKYIE